MRYDEAMGQAEAGYHVRRMNWRDGWHVRRSGGRLVYATSTQRAKEMGWVPTQLDKDAADWVYGDKRPAPPKPKRAARKAKGQAK